MKIKRKLEFWVVDLVLSATQRVPGAVTHNLAKAKILKTVMWHLNVDGVQGAYVEFGVARGHSMRAADLAERFSFNKSLGIPRNIRSLYGFDTFEHFSSSDLDDSHDVWNGGAFNESVELIRSRFQDSRVKLVKCDVSLINKSERCGEINSCSDALKGEGVAVVLFDMDLYDPLEKPYASSVHF